MAPDATQIIRDGLTAWSRGDLDGTLGNFSPDIEFVPSGLYPGLEPVYRGRGGFADFWKEFRDTWQGIEIDVERIVAGGPGRYAVLGRFRAAGREGIPVERPVGMAFTVEDGLITHIRNFGSGEEALAAARAVTSGND